MLIDTHCHLNTMVKEQFDRLLTPQEIEAAHSIIKQAVEHGVATIINVGTSIIESQNCIALAQRYKNVFATIGIHPNDTTPAWRDEFKQLVTWARNAQEHKIVGIGEAGLDFHYPDYNIQRQKDAFKAQIELALEYDLAVVVHTRDAGQETLRCLEEYKNQIKRGVIHCFSEDMSFAEQVIEWNFYLGIGGTLTYPKNTLLRDIVQTVSLDHIVLETDAPFLPPQTMRGQKNHPLHIATVTHYIAQLRQESFEKVAQQTTGNAERLFNLT